MLKENCINLHSNPFISKIHIYSGSNRLSIEETKYENPVSIVKVLQDIKDYLNNIVNDSESDSIKVHIYTLSGYQIYFQRFLKYNGQWCTLDEIFKSV